jgi:hypothetical protein
MDPSDSTIRYRQARALVDNFPHEAANILVRECTFERLKQDLELARIGSPQAPYNFTMLGSGKGAMAPDLSQSNHSQGINNASTMSPQPNQRPPFIPPPSPAHSSVEGRFKTHFPVAEYIIAFNPPNPTPDGQIGHAAQHKLTMRFSSTNDSLVREEVIRTRLFNAPREICNAPGGYPTQCSFQWHCPPSHQMQSSIFYIVPRLDTEVQLGKQFHGNLVPSNNCSYSSISISL